MILAPLQKLPKNLGDLGKLIVAKGFKKLPKVQKIAKSGHTESNLHLLSLQMAKMNHFQPNQMTNKLLLYWSTTQKLLYWFIVNRVFLELWPDG